LKGRSALWLSETVVQLDNTMAVRRYLAPALAALLWGLPATASAQQGIPYLVDDEEDKVGDPDAESLDKPDKRKGKGKGKRRKGKGRRPKDGVDTEADVDADTDAESPNARRPSKRRRPGSSADAAGAEKPEEPTSQPDEVAQPPDETTAEAPEEPPAPAYDTKGRPAVYFSEVWRERREALNKGDTATAKAKLDEMVEARAESGWPNLMVYGQVLAYESRLAERAGDPNRAVELARNARAIAPDLSSIRMRVAFAQWNNGEYIAALGALKQAVRAAWTQPAVRHQRVASLVLACVATLFLTALAFALIALFRYARLLAHDLRYMLPGWPAMWQVGTVLSALVLGPLLFGLGISWALVVWLVLGAAYYSRRECIAAAVLAAMLAFLPLNFSSLMGFLAYPDSASHAAYLSARAVIARESLLQEQGPADGDVVRTKYIEGVRAQWAGDLVASEAALQAAIAAGGNNVELFNTLGNVRLLMGNKPGAIVAYQRAMQQDTAYVPAQFNMARTYYAMAEHRLASEAHRRASDIDYEAVEVYEQQARKQGSSYVVEADLPKGMFSISELSTPQDEAAVEHAWRLLAGTPRSVFGGGALIAMLLILALHFTRGSTRPSSECRRCGMPVSLRFDPELPDQTHCGQCHQVFVVKHGVDDQARIRKEIEVHRYQASIARLRFLFSALFAGTGQLAVGRTARGLLLTGSFAYGVVALLGGAGVIHVPHWYPAPGPPVLGGIIAGMLVVLSYVVAQWDMVKGR